MGHDYILNQYLSPMDNRGTDEYVVASEVECDSQLKL
jgi:2,4-dienoyl-CoA reductase-like NADH-dependent reductase (Old Yellow Enzyme family)